MMRRIVIFGMFMICLATTGCALDGTYDGAETDADWHGDIASNAHNERALHTRLGHGKHWCQTGTDCPNDQFCELPAENACGASDDQLGICSPRPDFCPAIFDPVCGCDGVTYSNQCEAERAGINVVQAGACDQPVTCGGFAGLVCPAGLTCVDDPTDECDPTKGSADCAGVCELAERGVASDSISVRPIKNDCRVTGCSGQLCIGADEPDVITTCEVRDEYLCYQDAQCERQLDGECGFTLTPELVECLAGGAKH